MIIAKAIKDSSTIQSFFKEGKVFLNIRSETANTKTASIHRAKNKPFIPRSTEFPVLSVAKWIAPTKLMATIIFNGVNLSEGFFIF